MTLQAPQQAPGTMLQKILGSRLVAALTYPRGVERYVQLVAPTFSLGEVRAEVVAVRRETPDVVTLELRPNGLLRAHRAGQYVALTAEVRGVRRTRCFSLSSAPGGERVEVTIKARPGGVVTPELVGRLRAGAVVTLSQPQGDFVLPEPLPERLLLISGGSGVTPVMAMLRWLRASSYAGRVVFVHYARSAEDVIFGAELGELARGADERFTVVIETEREAGKRPELTDASLSALVGDLARWEAYACGPEPLLAAVRRVFEARGAGERVHTERFTLATAAGGGEGGRVEFKRSGKSAEGKGKLLVMAEEAGLNPPSGCRSGICHTCKCRKLSGATRDVRTGELSTDADVDIQLCVSEAVGEVTLDL